MRAMPPYRRLLFASALVALGITGLANGDFALVWQDVPPHLPGRTMLAYACAIIEVGAGLGLLLPRTVRPASRIALGFMALWMVLLVVPRVAVAPLDAGAWGSVGEIGAMTAGAWVLFATHGTARPAVGATGVRAARWLLILALACLGQEVIVDAVAAGDQVMQPWLQRLPWPAGWAILSGVCSIAACLALLLGIRRRLAATLEAAMVVLIGLAYWAPVLHTGRTATTAFIVTLLVAAGTWLVADTYGDARLAPAATVQVCRDTVA